MAREAATELLLSVTEKGRALDDAALARATSALDPRDRGFVRLLVAETLRRQGRLEALISRFLTRPLPDRQKRLNAILVLGAAQLVVLGTPAHAAINLAVEQSRRMPDGGRFDKLVNAVLRRISEQGLGLLKEIDGDRLDIPPWLWERWVLAYGEPQARAIAAGSLNEAPLEITTKSEPEAWASRLGGALLPTGTIRLARHAGRIEDLAGFAEGGWWVQDAAAALPARLLGAVAGQCVLDLCAAPGGKTMQLAAAGARVTAVDVSQLRLDRLRQNLTRVGLSATLVASDASEFFARDPFDAVLLDAPCTATGTIRRHPDILRLKRPGDVRALAVVQERLIDAAARLVKPGGTLVYCTCSLEPEEGEQQIAALLERNDDFERRPIAPGECGIPSGWIDARGDLRTLPSDGVDGFYAARLVRKP